MISSTKTDPLAADLLRCLARPLVDCPRCGARPPCAHYLGGGPGFDGLRVCGNCHEDWEDDDLAAWLAMRPSAH